MKLDEIEALARDGETDAASVLALIAVVRAGKVALQLECPSQRDRETFAAALAQLEQSP